MKLVGHQRQVDVIREAQLVQLMHIRHWFGKIDAHKTLVAEALDECAIEIASLKYMTTEKSHRLGNHKKCCVPRGSYEKAAVKICNKYNLKMSDISIDTAISITKVG
jgi:hypothetical protein